jgi:hypothetical protein
MPAEETSSADDLRKEIESLKAKVVELEQKLSKVVITEEEWKTYNKVSAILAGQAGLPEHQTDDKAADPQGGLTVVRRNPFHLTHLFRFNVAQGKSTVVPAFIVSGFGDLGF